MVKTATCAAFLLLACLFTGCDGVGTPSELRRKFGLDSPHKAAHRAGPAAGPAAPPVVRNPQLVAKEQQLLKEIERLRKLADAQRRLLDEQRKRQEQDQKRVWTAKLYAQAVGQQVVKQVGGRDLVVNVRRWAFDPVQSEYEIDIEVSFNGEIIRSNNYRVAGRLTVKEDGSRPRFARTAVNQNFKELEETMLILKGTAFVLKELSKK